LGYQWSSSTTTGGPYAPITGATGISYTTPALSGNVYYTVAVTCTNSGSTANTAEFGITVNPLPTISVTPNAVTICPGAGTTLVASGSSTAYAWTPATGLSGTSGTSVTASPAVSTVYTITGTANGCSNTATASVTVAPNLSVTAKATAPLICMNGSSQLSAVAGSSAYSVTAVAYAPVPTPGSGVTTLVSGGAGLALSSGNLNDGRWDNIALPFSFNFYGNNYTSLSIGTNGYVVFGTPVTTGGYNLALPSAIAPNNAIHVATADLDFRSPSTGTIEYFVDGAAPNRRFVINYKTAGFYDVTAASPPVGNMTVQAVLFEGSNAIEIHNTTVSNTTVNKTQGVENANGTAATLTPARNNTALWTGMPDAYRFAIDPVNYSWSPASFLNDPNIAGPLASNVSATTIYTVTATDAVTGCLATDTTMIKAGTALTAVITTQYDTVCSGNSAKIYATPAGGGMPYAYSWSDGVTTLGTSDTVIVTPGVNTSYALTVTDNCGNTANATVAVTVNNPTVTAATPGTRCGAGTVPLSATGSAGSSLTWYAAATGGVPLATGPSFTTPVINATTDYYVSASLPGATQNLGAAGVNSFPNISTSASFTAGMLFDVTGSSATIRSVDIYPTAAIGTNFQIVIRSGGAAGPVIATYQGTTTVSGTVASPVVQTVPVNFIIPGGTGYAMTFYNGTLNAPLSGTAVYPGALRNNPATGSTFPYTLPATISITNGSVAGAWYFFYNWKVPALCESPRTAVKATVTTVPAFSVSPATTICNNAVRPLSVTSNLPDYDTYTWSPAAGLYSDPAATTAYTGGNASVVYAKNNTGGTYTYVATANNNSGTCQNIDSVKLTILPAGISINNPAAPICISGNATLGLSPSSGYSGASVQWFTSPDGSNFTAIGGANGTSYATPALTATTYYQALIKDAAGNSCQQPAITVAVKTPQILTTVPATRCGTGSLALNATASAGAGLNWYDGPGGTLLGSGSSFTTPVISTTTPFYVAADEGGCISTSVSVMASVSGNTTIITQPVAQTTCAGNNILFPVAASGAGLQYQWRKDGVNINGATKSIYSITGVATSDNGYYDVLVSGFCGNIVSNTALLTVASSNSWLGTISSDWNTASNWCGSVPTSASDVVINAGAPFLPVLDASAEARSITIGNGASLTIGSAGFLNIYGDFTNNGSFNATNGLITFKGGSLQHIGSMTAGTVLINGAGISLTGDMSVVHSLILTGGNIVLGNSNLTLNGSIQGSTGSHVVTNGNGGLISTQIGSASVTIPIGPDNAHYNPVVISNGQGIDYTVKVATGILPAIPNSGRAINRTWTITPASAPAANVNILLQYANGDQNSNCSPSLVMETGVYNGSSWNVVSPLTGVTPSGFATAYQVGYATTQFGPTVVANIGGFTTPLSTPNVDVNVNRILMIPNPVESRAVLRVQTTKAMKINWLVIDAGGSVVMSFAGQVTAGQNDLSLDLAHLASGVYQIVGLTEKGKTRIVRFVKM
jgi:hypothetical protein